MAAQIITQCSPQKPTIALGKLCLELRMWKYLLSLENLHPNEALDLRKPSLIRNAIKDRLVTKLQMGHVSEKVSARLTQSIRLVIPSEYERKLCIFLTPSAMSDINSMLYQHFLDMMQSYVDKQVRQSGKSAKQCFLEFLDLSGLSEDDFDWESTFDRADRRLRETRNMPSYFALRPIAQDAEHVRATVKAIKKRADGQIMLEIPS